MTGHYGTEDGGVTYASEHAHELNPPPASGPVLDMLCRGGNHEACIGAPGTRCECPCHVNVPAANPDGLGADAAPDAHQFPCQPPQGDLLAPGDCLVCGKPYALDVAQKRAAEAGLAVVDPADLRAALTSSGILPDDVYDRLRAAAGMAR